MDAPMNLTRRFELLSLSDDKKGVLGDIKTCLLSLPVADYRLINANLFNSLFNCLNTSDGEQVKLVCDILNVLLNYIQPENVLNQFHDELQAGMAFAEERVRELCAKQVLRAAKSGIHNALPHSDLVSQVVLLIGDDALSTAQHSINLLTCLGKETEGLELVFQGNVFDQINSSMAKSDVVRFRVYEAIVQIASVSPETLYVCVQSGILGGLMNELGKDDILVQLNVLELLKDLALVHHGIVFLEQEGIIGRLEEMLGRVDSDQMMTFLLPGLIKFFGNIAHQQPKEICGRFQVFINMVFGLLENDDTSLRVIAIETLCFIGQSSEGKLALEKQGDQMKKACRSIGRSMDVASSEYRIRILQAVNSLFTLKVVDQTAESLSLTEQWHSNLWEKPMETIMSVAQQPFIQLRCAALEHFATLALTLWGQKILNSYPGFNEYLLNRSTENSKEGKEGKYEIIKTLVESPTVQEVFGQPYYVKLKVYEREGPFYILAEAAVALEGS